MNRWWIFSGYMIVFLIIISGTGILAADRTGGETVLSEINDTLSLVAQGPGMACSYGATEGEILLPENNTFESLIRPIINGTDLLCVIIIPNGTICYSSHPAETSKFPPDNVVTEVPTFRDVFSLMSNREKGIQFYDLWKPEPQDPESRMAIWKTVSINGTEWRVMVGVPV